MEDDAKVRVARKGDDGVFAYAYLESEQDALKQSLYEHILLWDWNKMNAFRKV